MDTLFQDLRFAVRSLRFNPGFTAIAVLALALGIGGSLAVFSIVNAVLISPLPFEEPRNLVVLWGNVKRAAAVERRGASLADYFDWKAQSKSYASMAAYWDAAVMLQGVNEPERLSAEIVDADYFSTLGVKPVAGRVFRAEEEGRAGAAPAAAVLGHSLWQRRFGGDPAIAGKTLRIDANEVTVIGVMPHGFRGATDSAEIWLPLRVAAGSANEPGSDRSSRWFPVLARLAAGVSREQAQAEITAISGPLDKTYPATNENRSVEIARLDEEMRGQFQPPLLVILAAVGFVLLIACANVANLLLARAEKRQKEIAIRAAMGAGRGRLARQLITEGMVLAALGAIVGGLSAGWAVDALVAASPVEFPSFATIRIDPTMALFAMALTALTGVALGLAPAVHAWTGQIYESLADSSGRSSGGVAGQRLRGALVVSEIALTLVLLTGAGLLIRSFQKLTALHPGFEAGQLLALRVGMPPSTAMAPAQAVLERVRGLAMVKSASLGSDIPLAGESSAVFYSAENPTPGDASQSRPRAYVHRVTPVFFATLGIPLLRGRDFLPDETGVVIVSEGVWKRFWPDQDPIGRRIQTGRPGSNAPWATIAGVVGETNFRALPRNPTPDPDLYFPFPERARQFALFVRAGGDAASLIPSIRADLRSVDASAVIYNAATMEERIGRQTAPWRFTSWLTGIFSAVALLLATVGTYGVVSLAVARRTREVGIRMALGASGGEVVGMVTRQGLLFILPGIGIGLALGLAAARLISGLLFGVTPADPITFISAALAVGAVALLATMAPALRATRIDPMAALRNE